jgi:hypothetical protein
MRAGELLVVASLTTRYLSMNQAENRRAKYDVFVLRSSCFMLSNAAGAKHHGAGDASVVLELDVDGTACCGTDARSEMSC